MIKNIIKEIVIILLLLLSISMILGIIFYDYIPRNKTVPVNVKEYAMPEDVKEELAETVTEEQKIIRTLFIDSKELYVYESSNEYNKGKANPFKDYGLSEEEKDTNEDKNESKHGKNNSEDSPKKEEDYGPFYKKGKNK